MKIGYPCINNTIGCRASARFILKNYSEKLVIEKSKENILCLVNILRFNVENDLKFFRLSSGIIPFASHPINNLDWQNIFKNEFIKLGQYIKEKEFRISMHPDQFVVLNSKNPTILKNSINELKYHCELLDLLKLNNSAKVQIHIGGVYGNKNEAIKTFIQNYKDLPEFIKKRLAIENDDYRFSLKDCYGVYEKIGVPIIFDSFHHECLNNNERIIDALRLVKNTWNQKDGIPMVDYSSQKFGSVKGAHTNHIDINHFANFLKLKQNFDCDIMLEIKDKEVSAIKAIKFIKNMAL